MEIRAYAGPMDLERAQAFRKIWKTPPRVPRTVNRNSNGRARTESPNCHSFRLLDVEKGLERVGRWGIRMNFHFFLCLFPVVVNIKIITFWVMAPCHVQGPDGYRSWGLFSIPIGCPACITHHIPNWLNST